MPFARPTLTQLRKNVAADIAANLVGSDPQLRFSNLNIMGTAQAGLAHLHYGYLDWIAKQAVPYTATGEYLEAWGALKGVYRKDATASGGSVILIGEVGKTIAAGAKVVRGDGETYVVQVSVTVGADRTATVLVVDQATGAQGNCAAGTVLSLSMPIDGVQANGTAATAFTGGADVELDDDFRVRVLDAFQSPAEGGNADDYVKWATAVPGVTRAWIVRNGFGAGSVVVYTMFDQANSASGGFPQGSDGVATLESRSAVKATGDQLTVANAIYPKQPVTALVYSVAPIASPVNFTITGLTSSTSATRAAILVAIADVMFRKGAPGGTVNLSDIESAIAAVPSTAGFVITVPSGNIVATAGHIPTVGIISYP
ncbi:baseplate J/gp47 family protein [Cupriavidus pauculus]|uniref:baseplate J/gp47 family protein n=1 Tax=Cupriavidus pauculus TaxID=82633 RepID=UPI001EE1C400|nr:baseplate J/gp47 family protein [Cupriavidus pauculus]GJG92828.1 phage baseplate protein [Cupriavidus pauculus]